MPTPSKGVKKIPAHTEGPSGGPAERHTGGWFQDKARIGHKNGLVRQWARRGRRPRQHVPENITPIFLPSRSPELSPVENLWQYLRSNWLSNRVFATTHHRRGVRGLAETPRQSRNHHVNWKEAVGACRRLIVMTPGIVSDRPMRTSLYNPVS
ncbi:hypothetical protein EN836_32055 [Mesorhizobium sp. M1C.F.Ca.ET.193.01.1.1]|nr:hypothetical protein EJ074_18435 [Mesorhizobium sp. M3A.F.Ca.ET.080.04.2.1]RWA59285.1 MAG: hypothetical protein EOQ29_34095 [Mesorhizobium sp.]TGQ49793.1 hypothetical protein EN853_32050 [Mesorhizobium sp. M1C.F.Ca.ET.210.01.1.1]TGQ62697.1 hypothetical protein EN848_32285 [bacterium M00.F.Ca.ET.205.01.1.1]TGQ64261.1 hypothetical protein EN855_032065 [Mesorhizobium sp. M1C.F.Ca.ET.212.01.1.1]TGQ97711.1 hypothetical protein EN847_32415 [Mesorhizobium sp. M1C.F.Ca.ET.204.01.1.1]TGR17997.1 hyp